MKYLRSHLFPNHEQATTRYPSGFPQSRRIPGAGPAAHHCRRSERGGHPSTKPGLKVNEDADITIRNRPRYVSRGGLKMEGALNAFPVSAEGKVCLDIGASTGGFTDCSAPARSRQGACHRRRNQPACLETAAGSPRHCKRKIQRPLHDSGGYWGTSGSDRFRRLLYLSEKILPAAFPLLKQGGMPWCSSSPSLNSSRKI